jgi:pimeloyl-ACP methyl ester carboxylesterase
VSERIFIPQAKSPSLWEGHVRHDFTLNGRDALVVEPKAALDGKPWVWRTEFFDAFAQVDRTLLAQGWHLAYFKVSDMYGCPEAIALMRAFQTAAEDEFGLAKRAVLFGFSRGGLYAFNYAAQYPQKVAVLYLDAPVLDIKSWPGGKGIGVGSQQEWEDCLRIFGLTEESAESFKGNPLDRIEAVADASIPIILVAGGADDIVPYKENGKILAERYRELGGTIQVIVKPDCGHHPHSLEDPSPVVSFITKEALLWE